MANTKFSVCCQPHLTSCAEALFGLDLDGNKDSRLIGSCHFLRSSESIILLKSNRLNDLHNRVRQEKLVTNRLVLSIASNQIEQNPSATSPEVPIITKFENMGSNKDASSEVTTEPAPLQGMKRRSFVRSVSLRIKKTLSLDDKSEETGKPLARRQSDSGAGLAYNPLLKDRKVVVRRLDGSLMYRFPIEKNGLTGQELMDRLKCKFGLEHAEYFGFRVSKSSDDPEDLRNPWLNMARSIRGQLRKVKFTSSQSRDDDFVETRSARPPEDITLFLKIRYYPYDFEHIREVFLCDYLFLQLVQDLGLGKLIGSDTELAWLLAHILQVWYGNWTYEFSVNLSEISIMPDQDLYESKAVQYWMTNLSGLSYYQAQMHFIRSAFHLETYGITYHRVKDQSVNSHLRIGFNYEGVKTFNNVIHAYHRILWTSIVRIEFTDSDRCIQFYTNTRNYPVSYFTCFSKDEFEDLCSDLLDQRRFFNAMSQKLESSARPPRPQFKVLPPVGVSLPDQQGSQRAPNLTTQPCQASPFPNQQYGFVPVVGLSDNTNEPEEVVPSVSKINQPGQTVPQKVDSDVSKESLAHRALELGSLVPIREEQSSETLPVGCDTSQPNLSEPKAPSHDYQLVDEIASIICCILMIMCGIYVIPWLIKRALWLHDSLKAMFD